MWYMGTSVLYPVLISSRIASLCYPMYKTRYASVMIAVSKESSCHQYVTMHDAHLSERVKDARLYSR